MCLSRQLSGTLGCLLRGQVCDCEQARGLAEAGRARLRSLQWSSDGPSWGTRIAISGFASSGIQPETAGTRSEWVQGTDPKEGSLR